MGNTNLVSLHLATVLPAFVIGAALMARRKGTVLHKSLGCTYWVQLLA